MQLFAFPPSVLGHVRIVRPAGRLILDAVAVVTTSSLPSAAMAAFGRTTDTETSDKKAVDKKSARVVADIGSTSAEFRAVLENCERIKSRSRKKDD
jgi:hypothetical protein